MTVRTGQEYLDGLKATSREIWLGEESVESVVDHPLLGPSASSIAAYYDLHHQRADEMITVDPDTGEDMALSHLLPRSSEDLERRHVALLLAAELSIGMMGRTPDYMNVTFAGFASDRTRWIGNGESNAVGCENLVAFQRRLRASDLSLTHTIVHPTIDKETDKLLDSSVPLHKVGETPDSIVVRGARMLATLAPFADEQTVYPGSPIPEGVSDSFALSFTIAMDAPGLVFLCRDSGTRICAPGDAPISSRFDEQDAYCIFDDVEVPKENVFIDGDLEVYNSVMHAGPWWPNVMQQTTVRALTKLEFLYGLAECMAEAVNDRSEKTTDLLGEIQTYVEMTRSALMAAMDHPVTWDDGGVFPDGRAMHPIRALLPTWMVRVNEILRVIGGANLLATPSQAVLTDRRIGELCEEFLPGAAGMKPSRRSEIFRLAWDHLGSTLGSRNELYERHYLGSPTRTHLSIQRLYSDENRARGKELVAKMLAVP